MRKTRLVPMVFVAMALTVTMTAAQEGVEEKPWFDLTNCAFCKNLGAEEGLIENIQWESHKISTGMLSIAMVPAEYAEAFERAGKNMEAVAKRLEAGGQVPLCGFCMSYGKLMMSGAEMEELHTRAGHISLVTSADPEVVKMIHAHAQRTVEEHEKWLAARATGGQD